MGQDGGGYRFESGQANTGIFLREGLDRTFADLPVGQCVDHRVQPPLQKYFRFPLTRLKSISPAVPSHRGALAIVIDAGRDAVDAAASGAQRNGRAGWRKACELSIVRRRTALKRTAKPCGPGTRCWCQVGGGASARPGLDKPYPSMTVTRTNSSPGRARRKPLKPLRAGMPGVSGVLVVTNARATYTTRAAAGARAPGIPHALLGEGLFQKLGRIAPRLRFDVIARSDLSAVAQRAKAEATKQSSSSFVGWAKARLRRAHLFEDGGHASLCPPYSSSRFSQ